MQELDTQDEARPGWRALVRRFGVPVLTVVLVAAGTGWWAGRTRGRSEASPAVRTFELGGVVIYAPETSLTEDARFRVERRKAPIPDGLVAAGDPYEISLAEGVLLGPITITVPLDGGVALDDGEGGGAVAAVLHTEGSAQGLVPAVLAADGHHVSFTTSSLSIFNPVTWDWKRIRAKAKKAFHFITDDAFSTAGDPTCAGPPAPVAATPTLKSVGWCASVAGAGAAATVVNRRHYVMAVRVTGSAKAVTGTDTIAGHAVNLVNGVMGTRARVLDAGGEATVTLPDRASSAVVGLDTVAYLVDTLVNVVATVTTIVAPIPNLNDLPKHLDDAIEIASCGTDVTAKGLAALSGDLEVEAKDFVIGLVGSCMGAAAGFLASEALQDFALAPLSIVTNLVSLGWASLDTVRDARSGSLTTILALVAA